MSEKAQAMSDARSVAPMLEVHRVTTPKTRREARLRIAVCEGQAKTDDLSAAMYGGKGAEGYREHAAARRAEAARLRALVSTLPEEA